MATKRPFANPFYALLLVVGVAFLLTATSYGVLAFRDVQGQSASASGSGLMQFLDRHGALLLAGEVGVLIVASLAAMATDGYWSKRGQPNLSAESQAESQPDDQ